MDYLKYFWESSIINIVIILVFLFGFWSDNKRRKLALKHINDAHDDPDGISKHKRAVRSQIIWGVIGTFIILSMVLGIFFKECAS